MLLVIDVKMVEIAFIMIAPLRNSLELYIDTSVKNPPHETAYPPISNLFFEG